MVMPMGTLTHLPTPLCQATSPDGRMCAEAHGHTSLGLSHMDTAGNEWLDDGILGTYLSDPPRQMAEAS
jgi:hypothetical protein